MGRGANGPLPNFLLWSLPIVIFALDLNALRELNLHTGQFKEVSMPRSISLRVRSTRSLLLIGLGMLLLPASVNAQGSGRSSTGTDGVHIIQGYIFFPSGRKADGNIVVKLQSTQFGELQVVPIRAAPSYSLSFRREVTPSW